MTQRRVIFAIPAYDFTAHLDTIGSIIVAGEKLRMAGIQWGLIYQGGSSIVSRARNSLVDGFLEMEDATDLVFIDSDIVFDADELLTLIHWGETKDIVCGAYRIKREDVTRFPVHVKMNDQGGAVFDKENKRLLQVTGCGAGFMLIRRNVFKTMQEKLDIPMCKDGARGETATFFHFAVEGDQYVGEDIYFCRKAIEAGFDIWCDPYLTLTHIGQKEFTGRLVDHFEVIREGDEGKLKESA